MNNEPKDNFNQENINQTSPADVLANSPSFEEHIKQASVEKNNDVEVGDNRQEYFRGLSEVINDIEDEKKRNIVISTIGALSKTEKEVTEADKIIMEKLIDCCKSDEPAPTSFKTSLYSTLINWGGSEIDNMREANVHGFAKSLMDINSAVDTAETVVYSDTYMKDDNPNLIELCKISYSDNLEAGKDALGQSTDNNGSLER